MPKLKTREQLRIEELEALAGYQARLLAENNIVQYDATADHIDFENACAKFRGVCDKVRALLGLTSFFGSYDEIELYRNREELNTPEGRALKEDLTLYNQLCIHEGNKIGLPPPQWFKKCWGID